MTSTPKGGPSKNAAANDTMPPVGERRTTGLALRHARHAAKIETAQAAALSGFSVSQLGAIERGDHSLTSVSAGSLSRLPEAFGLTWPAFVRLVRPTYGAYIRLFGPECADPFTVVTTYPMHRTGVYCPPVLIH